MSDDKPYKTYRWPKDAREGHIPYYAEWSDGSWYSVVRVDEKTCERRYGGPFFTKTTTGTQHIEQFAA